MEANRSRLALLGRLYEIWSWVGLVLSLGGLLLVLVDGQRAYGITLGVTGTLYWVILAAVHFVIFQGIAQGVALLLSVEELATRSLQRAGELATVVLTGQARVDAKLAQVETALTMLLQRGCPAAPSRRHPWQISGRFPAAPLRRIAYLSASMTAGPGFTDRDERDERDDWGRRAR